MGGLTLEWRVGVGVGRGLGSREEREPGGRRKMKRQERDRGGLG